MDWSKFNLVGLARAIYEGEYAATVNAAERFGTPIVVTTWDGLTPDQQATVVAYAYRKTREAEELAAKE